VSLSGVGVEFVDVVVIDLCTEGNLFDKDIDKKDTTYLKSPYEGPVLPNSSMPLPMYTNVNHARTINRIQANPDH
jgi:hypothetical protein